MEIKYKKGLKNIQSSSKGRKGNFGDMRFRELIEIGENELIDKAQNMK